VLIPPITSGLRWIVTAPFVWTRTLRKISWLEVRRRHQADRRAMPVCDDVWKEQVVHELLQLHDEQIHYGRRQKLICHQL
jgi:hypothetical protein